MNRDIEMGEVINSVIAERTGMIEEWLQQKSDYRDFQAALDAAEKILIASGHEAIAKKLWLAIINWDIAFGREVYIQGFRDHEKFVNTKPFDTGK